LAFDCRLYASWTDALLVLTKEKIQRLDDWSSSLFPKIFGYGYCTLMLHEFADANVQLDWQALPGDRQRVTKSARLWIVTAAKRDTLNINHFITGQQ